MRKLWLLGVLIWIAPTTPTTAVTFQAPDLQQVWESMLAAKGGRARLDSVEAFVFSSSIKSLRWSASDVAGAVNYEFVIGLPDALWGWEDYRPGSMGFLVQSYRLSEHSHWVARNGGTAKQVWRPDGEAFLRDRIEELQVLYFLQTQFVKPRLLMAEVELSGRSIRLAAETPQFERIEYVVDLSSKLVRRVRLTARLAGGNAVPHEFEFEGEQVVSGFHMPERVQGFGRIAFEINPPIDSRLFDEAPSGVTGAGAWRKWLRKR